MKVLQVGKFYPIKGGVEKVMYDLAVNLSSQNCSCDMLCVALDNKFKIIPIANNANIYAVKHYGKYASTYISFDLIRWLRKNHSNYNIIHIHHPDPMAALALWLSGYKGKVYLHWHSDIIKQKLLLKLFAPLQTYLIKRAVKVIGTTPTYIKDSKFLKDYLDKSLYVPIGINPKEYEANEEQVQSIKSKFQNKKIVFSLGRFVYYKGFDYLIKSAQFLNDNTVIVIGGTGKLFQECKELIESLNLQHKVFLLGYLKDAEVPNYFAACDIYCLSSIEKSEAFGIVLIEAMLFGKPIVSTNIVGSGVSWVNQHNETGIVVPPSNANSIATAINTILGDNILYQNFSKSAKRRFENNFTVQTMVKNVMDIYNDY